MSTSVATSSSTASSSSASLGSGDSALPLFVHPAAAVCVKTHVPFTLEMNSNYMKWVSYLKLFGSIGDSILALALAGDDHTTWQLWVAIEEIFTANQEPRAFLLPEEFHTLQQGDSTISEYCQRIKLKGAKFRTVGNPVEGRALILAMLRGLNPRFASTVDDITNSTILPMFTRAHDMLILKETRLSHDEKSIANTALLAFAGSGCTSPGGCCSGTTGAPSGGSSNGVAPPQKIGGSSSNKKKGGGPHRGNGGGNGGGGHTQQASTSAAPQPYHPMGPWICYNPWAP
ncbi:uncharacterized protein LOC120684872 [Panicum virgatum]|uniref:uncharacterized protein LOC120684872 n=1 Tax=Panicum virgatum TaxID=38727 RepID=UPI0019D56891|nr:uncharacterized protein LOC120684872 [Panicum virgatum]